MVANRTTLNKEQKIALITYKNTNPSTSNVDLSKWIKQSYNLVVHPSTIGRILKRKIDDIVGNGSAKNCSISRIGECIIRIDPSKPRQNNIDRQYLFSCLRVWVRMIAS